jgi:hypothetical protein
VLEHRRDGTPGQLSGQRVAQGVIEFVRGRLHEHDDGRRGFAERCSSEEEPPEER